ncbi:MAG: hypothetical protein V4637_19805 [Pseudomonadota bacterium]
MFTKLTWSASFALALFAAGCSQTPRGGETIMQTVSGDPAGSANIGTGSVTTGSTIPNEAKAAGIGLGP